MPTEYQLSLHDYLSIMRRRAPYLISVFIAGLLVSAALAFLIPPTFRSTGTVLVESQQILDSVVSSAIQSQLDEQINTIRQRVMTRENLLEIAKKYNLYKDEIGTLTSSEILARLRDSVIIESAGTKDTIRPTRPGQQATAFTISYENRHPELALQVTQELITQFLDWNVKLRTEGAAETTDFLTQESDKLKIEVDRLERSIAEFKQSNRNALPEQLTLRVSMLARAENDLREVERDIRSTKEEIRTLEVELSAARRGKSDDNSSQSLPALKTELAKLTAIYNDSHPDIRRLKLRIEALEKSDAIPSPENNSTDALNPAIYKIQAKIESDNSRLISLAQQKAALQSTISENDRAMIQTPKVGQELDVLVRDRDIALKKFEEFRSKRMNAKIAENLESENKSGRFSVLEPPLFPEKPFKPDRVKIILLGFLLSLAAAVGVVIALEAIDKRIHGAEALAHILGCRPLAVIPYITTIDEGIAIQQNKLHSNLSKILAKFRTGG
jgi:polysaccharide chain length determinant protein (PEP-CTERM system associated)